jgi:septal ring factor EnvC (AmiA/AmiB activator)
MEPLEIRCSLSQTQNKIECHSRRLEWVEATISRLEDKVDTITKTREYIEKRLKKYKWNM